MAAGGTCTVMSVLQQQRRLAAATRYVSAHLQERLHGMAHIGEAVVDESRRMLQPAARAAAAAAAAAARMRQGGRGSGKL